MPPAIPLGNSTQGRRRTPTWKKNGCSSYPLGVKKVVLVPLKVSSLKRWTAGRLLQYLQGYLTNDFYFSFFTLGIHNSSITDCTVIWWLPFSGENILKPHSKQRVLFNISDEQGQYLEHWIWKWVVQICVYIMNYQQEECCRIQLN